MDQVSTRRSEQVRAGFDRPEQTPLQLASGGCRCPVASWVLIKGDWLRSRWSTCGQGDCQQPYADSRHHGAVYPCYVAKDHRVTFVIFVMTICFVRPLHVFLNQFGGACALHCAQ